MPQIIHTATCQFNPSSLKLPFAYKSDFFYNILNSMYKAKYSRILIILKKLYITKQLLATLDTNEF